MNGSTHEPWPTDVADFRADLALWFYFRVLSIGEQVPGSARYIGTEQIKRLGYNDLQRIIRQIPGVSVQIEDDCSLHPNISIYGVATEHSGRITLLKDKILISPVPYSAPGAYYLRIRRH